MKKLRVSGFNLTPLSRVSSWSLTALTCVFLSCFVPAQARCQAQADGNDYLHFEAQPLKSATKQGEPVYVRFRLTNVSNAQVLVNRHLRLFDIIDLQVSGPSGQRAEWCGHIPEIVDTPGAFVTLAPGARIEKVLLISCDTKMKWGYELAEAGNYEVTASYNLPQPLAELKKAAGSAVIVKGPVSAKPLRLTILPKP